MRIITCVQCHLDFQTESIRSDKRICPNCLHHNKILCVMKCRQKHNPSIEIGVGSGNSKINKLRPITINTYRKLKSQHCEICGSEINLCIHHIDGNRHNNNIMNLQTVCKQCHQKHHTIRDAVTGRYTR